MFSYGGCGGNTNNFQSEESCISTCGGPTGALVHAIQLHGGFFFNIVTLRCCESENCVAGGLKPRKAICNHPINRGGCQVNILSHQLVIIENLKFRQSFVDSTLTHAQKPVNSLSLVVVKVTLILLLFSTVGALVVKTVSHFLLRRFF